jgi:hypothetical protein
MARRHARLDRADARPGASGPRTDPLRGSLSPSPRRAGLVPRNIVFHKRHTTPFWISHVR